MIIDLEIPEPISAAIIALNEDEAFDKLYNQDEELDKLFDRMTDYEVETQLLQLNATGKVEVQGYEILGFSLLAINLLWLLHSPILFNLEKATYEDIELATWLLFNSEVDLDLVELKKKAKGFLAESGIPLEDALSLVMKNLQLAFYPLRCVLSNTEHTVKSNPLFDQMWVTHIVSTVSKSIKEDAKSILRMPLAVCHLYYVDYLRSQGNAAVQRLTDDDIKADIDIRTCELIVDYLIEKKIINITDRDTILASLTKDHTKK